MTNFIIAKEFDGDLWVRADEFHKVIKNAVEAEREACAQVCDDEMDWGMISSQMEVAAGNCADLIRARGQS